MDGVMIKSIWLKTLLSRLVTKILKKKLQVPIEFELSDTTVETDDDMIELNTGVRVRMSKSDITALLNNHELL